MVTLKMDAAAITSTPGRESRRGIRRLEPEPRQVTVQPYDVSLHRAIPVQFGRPLGVVTCQYGIAAVTRLNASDVSVARQYLIAIMGLECRKFRPS
jgi:hypothetical protein